MTALARKLREKRPGLIYLLDRKFILLHDSQRTESHDHLSAVLGDSGRLYVSPEVIPIYREALPLATIITPNWFEVE